MKPLDGENRETDSQTQAQPPRSPAQDAFEKNLKFMNKESYPEEYFESLFTEAGRIRVHTAGYADFPSGEAVIADPLVYLGTKYQTCLERSIPKGSYPIELSILYSDMIGLRIAAARLKISGEKAARHVLAEAKANSDGKKPFCFMGVDAGVGCITDGLVSREYDDFLRKWHSENPDKNHYDDYFAEYFAESYKNCPQFQDKYGDFIEWTVPAGGNRLVMFSSGLGDGIYSAYWGENEAGKITELVIPFLNPEFF
ncbi:MAG: DUF4241 domain-containing protein [Firmicutes bacterium]|nr:DUF4241 domain-containing protein [[Eubacterium] siraeum]MCM1488601.1 DUF4241 domain-containing protein [Bacillota bacterium]